MSDFCDFVPDDPSCAVPEPEISDDEENTGYDLTNDDDMEKDDMHAGAMKANVAFLLTAISGVVAPALWMFRYRSAIDTVGDTASSTNYFKMLDYLGNYPTLALHLVLSVTQLLSMLGIAGEVNLMAWSLASMIHMVVGTVYFLGFLFAHNQYHTIHEDTTASDEAQADALEAAEWLEARSYAQTIWGTHSMLVLYMHYEQWMHAQWYALPEEAKGEYKEGHGDGDHEGEMFSKLFRF